MRSTPLPIAHGQRHLRKRLNGPHGASMLYLSKLKGTYSFIKIKTNRHDEGSRSPTLAPVCRTSLALVYAQAHYVLV